MAHFPWEENFQRIGAMVAYIIESDNTGQDLECFQFIQVQKSQNIGSQVTDSNEKWWQLQWR